MSQDSTRTAAPHMSCEHTEHGIKIDLLVNNAADNSKSKLNRLCTKLSIYREFVLATLVALVEERRVKSKTPNSNSQVSAIDAFSTTGIAAIEWKKNLSDVHVTATNQGNVTLLKQNAVKNSIMCSDYSLDPSHAHGNLHLHQKENELAVFEFDPRCLMNLKSFDFIYLCPNKTTGAFMDAVFHSISLGGILCLVVPDLSVFARAPHVVRRAFSAQVVKTEYLKEMAARIVLAQAARSAAQYNKGVTVLYVVSHEDYLLITVQVCRGQGAVDASLDNIAQLLHCRFCEERTFLTNQLAPLEDVYASLQCTCKTSNVGKTGVILGPMWKGPIFNVKFLQQIKQIGKKLSLSVKFFELVDILISEGKCLSTAEKSSFQNGSKAQNSEEIKAGLGGPTSADNDSLCGTLQTTKSGLVDQKSTEHKSVCGTSLNQTSQNVQECDSHETSLKRKLDQDESGNNCAKKNRYGDFKLVDSENVIFYHNIKKFKKSTNQKLDTLVSALHNLGHRASRTHFDPGAVRTSASVKEVYEKA